MKTSHSTLPRRLGRILVALMIGLFIAPAIVAAPTNVVEVKANLAQSTPVLEWHASVKLPFSASYAEYTIQRSSDLTHWETVAGPIQGTPGVADEALRQIAPVAGDLSFYRVIATTRPGPLQNDAAGMYGYADAFSKQLQQLGQLPVDEFAQRYPAPANYLAAVAFDDTQAEYWDNFNLDPLVNNGTNTVKRYTDFRFTPEELAIFKTNAFVVSPRLGSYSFADAYYKLFMDDMPVFVSTDAILQAWHRTYATLLEEQEEIYLAPTVQMILNAMAAEIPALYEEAKAGPYEVAVKDADYFIAVARNLLATNNAYYPTALGSDPALSKTLNDIAALQAKTVFLFPPVADFWPPELVRIIDFSQFKPRGHYENSVTLQKYFRAMMWLGIIDLRLSNPVQVSLGMDDNFNQIFGTEWEFATAAVLNTLLDRSGQREAWMDVNRTIELFVGLGDALNFSQLNDVLTVAQVVPPYTQLRSAYDQILSGNLGAQNITSGYFESPLRAEQLKLPRTFAFLPQRFTMDSWAFTKTVFDQIIWDDDGIPGFEDKVTRRVPSALDVAFSVLGNNQVTPNIVDSISKTNGHRFRDGKRYQHNLAAVRNVIDNQNPTVWTNNIYASWEASLRALSSPMTGSQFPQFMRTRPWALKTVNTQLASWTQLRHDTALYVKQSYTPGSTCIYPKGYVEPRLEFWDAMQRMIVNTRQILEAIPMAPSVTFVDANGGMRLVDTANVKSTRASFLDSFATTVGTLKTISQEELAGIDLSVEEIAFLRGLIEAHGTCSLTARLYSGWYPHLYYRPFQQTEDYGTNEGSDFWDALVTDVHTDTPDDYTGDPGSILHEAIGNVHMAFIAVDCGECDLVMFAGPVLSHYEFELDVNTRWADSQWKSQIRSGQLPESPAWTKSYLVPGAYQLPSWVTD